MDVETIARIKRVNQILVSSRNVFVALEPVIERLEEMYDAGELDSNLKYKVNRLRNALEKFTEEK